jgi:hypothetical protein
MSMSPTNLNWPTNHVSGLIKENKWEWRKSFVDSNFNLKDVTCILAMLLCDWGSRGCFELGIHQPMFILLNLDIIM